MSTPGKVKAEEPSMTPHDPEGSQMDMDMSPGQLPPAGDQLLVAANPEQLTVERKVESCPFDWRIQGESRTPWVVSQASSGMASQLPGVGGWRQDLREVGPNDQLGIGINAHRNAVALADDFIAHEVHQLGLGGPIGRVCENAKSSMANSPVL